MSYELWKLLHIGSVVIFLGNITTGLFWAARAHRTRDFSHIASTFESIIRSDRWFTIPGVVGILISGVAAAANGNVPLLATGWILWPIVLFSISGIVFGIWVAPLQRKLVNMTRAGADSQPEWSAYSQVYKRWELWGLLALLTPVAALVIMVLKPSLPTL